MDDKTRQDAAAHRVGMKPSEIVDVAEAEGGVVITTHDGQKVFAPVDGPVRPWAGEPLVVNLCFTGPSEPVKAKARAR